MEKPWIKINTTEGKCLTRTKNPYLAAEKIVWATDYATDVKLLIDGYDYGSCNFFTEADFFEYDVAIVLSHIHDCLNIHKAVYEKSTDLHEERE